MAVTPALLIPPDFVPAAATTMYTAPATAIGVQIDHASAFNSDSVARTLTVYLIPLGGAVGDENALVKTLSFAAGETKLLPELLHKMPPSSTLRAVASSADKIALTVSGSVFS